MVMTIAMVTTAVSIVAWDLVSAAYIMCGYWSLVYLHLHSQLSRLIVRVMVRTVKYHSFAGLSRLEYD